MTLSEPMHQVLSILLREPYNEAARLAMAKYEFGLTATRYYQVINQLLDTPEAMAIAPDALHRYAQLSDSRRAWRRRRG